MTEGTVYIHSVSMKSCSGGGGRSVPDSQMEKVELTLE